MGYIAYTKYISYNENGPYIWIKYIGKSLIENGLKK